jgi:hypothetical protein
VSTFHPGTQIIKSRGNAFDIPPKSKPNTRTPPKKSGPKPSKLAQSVIALETSSERAARLSKKLMAHHPISTGTYPALSVAAKDQAKAKTAKLKGRS